jgi:nucleotide-binding universal stress UspA family protein
MLQSVNLILTEAPGERSALPAAIALAKRLGAHLDVICLAVDPLPTYGIEASAVPYVLDRPDITRQTEALVAEVRSVIPADLHATVEPAVSLSMGLSGMVARWARYSDIAVIARPYGANHAPFAPVVAEALLFGAGVPVLVTPDAGHPDLSRPFSRLCIAWNEGDEAMRAVRAALPFLQEATKVEIAVIGSRLGEADEGRHAAALQRWLGRHEIEAELTLLNRSDQSKADILTHFAAERGCEALVMGAYGHSRLREALLGGTTRDMLAKVPLPLLMAH